MSETSDYQKIQGSVATYLRCGGVVNNRINKCLLISLSVNKIFKIGKYLAKLRARRWLSRALRAPGRHTAKRWRKCMKQPRMSYTCELFLIIRYLLLLLLASVFTHSVCLIIHYASEAFDVEFIDCYVTWIEMTWLQVVLIAVNDWPLATRCKSDSFPGGLFCLRLMPNSHRLPDTTRQCLLCRVRRCELSLETVWQSLNS